jgi:DUF1009 family protein
MNLALESIGLIAGSKSLPLELARLLRAAGVRRIVCVAAEGNADPAIAGLVDDIVWVHPGQINKLIKVFTSRGVTQCVMAGQIAPKTLFDLRPDLRALGMLMRMKEKNAHTLFGAVVEELRKDGVEVIEATPWLTPLMPQTGFLLGPKLTDKLQEDVAYGFKVAKEISRLDIGQLAVVKDGTVLAVEGFEGTDACLTRGGELSGKDGGAVAVKVAKLGHDMRFDIPCLGAKTMETCAAARISVLAIESGKSILLERDQVEALAKKHKITLTTVA